MDAAHYFAYHGTMIGFLVRKTFYDLWDNMLRIVFLNLGFIASLAIPVFLPALIPIPALSAAVTAAGLAWCSIYLSAAALSVRRLSDYGIFDFADFRSNIQTGWPAGIAAGFVGFCIFLLIRLVIPFYLGMKSVLGLALALLVLWTLVLAVVSLQFFFAIRARLDTKIIKIMKKCFIIFFDNPGFAIFTLLYTLASVVLSVFLVMLLPGPAGILLFLDEALRLRLLKYDWQEANPPADPSARRRKIPWDAILIDDREKTGTRSLKNFIFPWKD